MMWLLRAQGHVQYELFDSADWCEALAPMAALTCVCTDFLCHAADSDCWDDWTAKLPLSDIVIAWFIHEALLTGWSERIVCQILSQGTCILIGWPPR